MLPALLLAASLAAQSGGAPSAVPATPPPPPPAAAPPGPPTAWPFRFDDDDYPASAMRGDHQGTVRYRVEIGPDGRVARCSITASSGSPELDQGTCRIVSRRARFAPARDSGGAPVPDAREGEVTWLLDPDD